MNSEFIPDPNTVHLYETWLQDKCDSREVQIKYLVESILKRYFRNYRITGPLLRCPAGGIRVNTPMTGLNLSLSYSDLHVLCAVSGDGAVGVDHESFRFSPDLSVLNAIVANYFSPIEFQIWNSIPEIERESRFLYAWTRKESLIKAQKKGIVDGLDRFAGHFFGFKETQTVFEHSKDWLIRTAPTREQSVVAHITKSGKQDFSIQLFFANDYKVGPETWIERL